MKNDHLYQNDQHVDSDDKSHIEIYKDVEKFKLGIWIAKAFSVFVLLIVTSLIVSYLYVSITIQQLADLSAAGALLSGFFEVIKVIVSP